MNDKQRIEEPLHVCIVHCDDYVRYETKGESGSEPCLGRPHQTVANAIKARFIARDHRTTFESM